ncbi:hypothetical protein LOZ65_006928, partial [Ophidiomyces ophidiicola]
MVGVEDGGGGGGQAVVAGHVDAREREREAVVAGQLAADVDDELDVVAEADHGAGHAGDGGEGVLGDADGGLDVGGHGGRVDDERAEDLRQVLAEDAGGAGDAEAEPAQAGARLGVVVLEHGLLAVLGRADGQLRVHVDAAEAVQRDDDAVGAADGLGVLDGERDGEEVAGQHAGAQHARGGGDLGAGSGGPQAVVVVVSVGVVRPGSGQAAGGAGLADDMEALGAV